MDIEIQNRFSGSIIVSGKYDSLRNAVEQNSANLRGADLRGADLRGANLIDANLIGADLRGANLIDANLIDADLGGANLRGADLRGANLIGADLRGANLIGANLIGANLIDADLRGADLTLPVIQIAGTAHSFWYSNGNLKIGCEYHHIEYWRIMYRAIGREHDYTEGQIAEYKRYIDMATVAWRSS